MYRKKSILAIIMARAGSKRLPGKNIKELCNKPLIAWTIEAAQKSKYIDRIIVSTDSKEISEIALQYNAETPFKRPPSLASDNATSEDTAIHAIKWLKENEDKEYDYIIQLQPTSPLRTNVHIDEAIEHLCQNDGADSLSSFYVCNKNPLWLMSQDEAQFVKPAITIKKEFFNSKKFLMPNGAIALIKTKSLLKTHSFYTSNTCAYIMEICDSVDIDTESDFRMAELYIQSRHNKKESIFIGKHEINENKRVFVIAEAGVNHNRNLDLALELIDKAAEIGADAIKFQTFKAHQVVTETGEMADYQKKNLGQEQKQIEMLKELELPENFYAPLMKRCVERKIIFLSTPHGGVESLDFLEKLNVQAYKIGSGDLTNYLLLERAAKTKKPIILSSGMSTLAETKNAVEFIKSKGNKKIIVLHCTSNYPCPAEEANLAAMKTLMTELDVPIGFSDHTQDSKAAIITTNMGSALYEFHLTLNRNLPGPDHVASEEPKEASKRIKAIRNIPIIMGSSIKQPTEQEKNNTLMIARKSLVASKNLSKGTVLCKSDLKAKRPANGISPIHYEELLGKRISKNIKKDQLLQFENFLN